ncbi:sirohydrochlorin chelatase [Pseudogemmobacter sonorensis]|uniref:sirohydrochlorin chelatase n=1 Tax=Pseudogemmobacter sonorensis TaxID=2989681 RepID=UPI0036844F7F
MTAERVVILAHGQPSDPGPAAAELVALTRRIAAHLPEHDLRAATLAEPGALAGAVAGGRGGLVFPLFMAGGWFTREAVPARLAAVGADPGEGAGTGDWRVLPPFGTARALHDLALAQIRESGAEEVLLAAHGSFRSAAPAEVAQGVAARIAEETGLPARAAFIEQEPTLAQMRGFGPGAVCLPFFAMSGGHVTQDLPSALAEAAFPGRVLPAIGLDRRVPALIADLIRQGAIAGRARQV